MLGPFTFTFTLESEEFEKFEKVAAGSITRLAGNKRVHRFKHGIQGYQI